MTDEEKALDDAMAILEEALTGNRGADQMAIAQEVVRWGALLLRKNADYGSSVWKSPILAPDCDPGVAIRVRMSDKINRLASLLWTSGFKNNIFCIVCNCFNDDNHRLYFL